MDKKLKKYLKCKYKIDLNKNEEYIILDLKKKAKELESKEILKCYLFKNYIKIISKLSTNNIYKFSNIIESLKNNKNSKTYFFIMKQLLSFFKKKDYITIIKYHRIIGKEYFLYYKFLYYYVLLIYSCYIELKDIKSQEIYKKFFDKNEYIDDTKNNFELIKLGITFDFYFLDNKSFMYYKKNIIDYENKILFMGEIKENKVLKFFYSILNIIKILILIFIPSILDIIGEKFLINDYLIQILIILYLGILFFHYLGRGILGIKENEGLYLSGLKLFYKNRKKNLEGFLDLLKNIFPVLIIGGLIYFLSYYFVKFISSINHGGYILLLIIVLGIYFSEFYDKN